MAPDTFLHATLLLCVAWVSGTISAASGPNARREATIERQIG